MESSAAGSRVRQLAADLIFQLEKLYELRRAADRVGGAKADQLHRVAVETLMELLRETVRVARAR